jgi:hypothetical protein
MYMERFGGHRALGAVLILMSAGCQPIPVPRLAPVFATEHGSGERNTALGDIHVSASAEERSGSVPLYRGLIPARLNPSGESFTARRGQWP